MELNEEAAYRVAVTMIPGVGSTIARKLIAWAGSAREVFEKKELLRKADIVSKRIVEAISQDIIDSAKRQIDIAIRNNINIVYYTDGNYPRKLAQCDDAPILYYTKGVSLSFDSTRTIGIVGSRLTDSEGRDNIFRLIEGLKIAGFNAVIISGLATGADTFAHQAAIKYGLPTAAVLGHGFDIIYPAQNRSLSREIINGAGVIITEYYYGHTVAKTNFPRRNRIVAGLCDAIVVVQSRDQGGALITADYAQSYGRRVLAFPGRANDQQYAGCNALIRDNRASLISSSDDLAKIMNWAKPSKNITQQELPLCFLEPKEIAIVDTLRKNGDLSMEAILAETKIPMAELSSILLTLEFKDVIKSLPGMRYAAV